MDGNETALIAAGSALAGAVIGVGGAFGIELYRARIQRRREAAERLLDTALEALNSVKSWSFFIHEWVEASRNSQPDLMYQHWNDSMSQRKRADASMDRLALIASPSLIAWITKDFKPVVDRLHKAIVMVETDPSSQRWAAVGTAEDHFDDLLDDAIETFRAEVADIRSGKKKGGSRLERLLSKGE